jgi:hypothetical protein
MSVGMLGGGRLVHLRTISIAAVAVGVAFRIVEAATSVPGADGAYYAAMGNSFRQGDEFLLPFGNGLPGSGLEPGLSHHQAPMWPFVLSIAYAVGGFSVATTLAASLVVSLVAIAVCFACTRSLFGGDKAWFVAGFVALDYFLIESAGNAYSENMVTIFYVATIWAILKSLEDDRYVVLAGMFAGAGYLTKSSIGYFFLLAGAMGFLWRFYYMRWNVLRNRYYLAAIGIFFAFVGLWAVRNLSAFGWPHWETSPYTNEAVWFSVSRPLEYAGVLAAKSAFFLGLLATVALFFAPLLVREAREWKDERISALLLAIGLPVLLGVFFAAAFYLYERQPGLFWADNIRYVDIVFVPLLWLALRRYSFPETWSPSLSRVGLPSLHGAYAAGKRHAFRVPFLALAAAFFLGVRRTFAIPTAFGAVAVPRKPGIPAGTAVAFLLAFGLASLNVTTSVQRPAEYAAAEYMTSALSPGDTIAIRGSVAVYYMYPQVAHLKVHFVPWNGTRADFLLSDQGGDISGYRIEAAFNTTLDVGVMDALFGGLTRVGRDLLGIPKPPVSNEPELYLYRPL